MKKVRLIVTACLVVTTLKGAAEADRVMAVNMARALGYVERLVPGLVRQGVDLSQKEKEALATASYQAKTTGKGSQFEVMPSGGLNEIQVLDNGDIECKKVDDARAFVRAHLVQDDGSLKRVFAHTIVVAPNGNIKFLKNPKCQNVELQLIQGRPAVAAAAAQEEEVGEEVNINELFDSLALTELERATIVAEKDKADSKEPAVFKVTSAGALTKGLGKGKFALVDPAGAAEKDFDSDQDPIILGVYNGKVCKISKRELLVTEDRLMDNLPFGDLLFADLHRLRELHKAAIASEELGEDEQAASVKLFKNNEHFATVEIYKGGFFLELQEAGNK